MEHEAYAKNYMRYIKSGYLTACVDDAVPEAFSGPSAPPRVWSFDMTGMRDVLRPKQAASEQSEIDFRVEATAEMEEPEGETTAERLSQYLMCNRVWPRQAEKREMFCEAKLSVDRERTWDFIIGNDLFKKFVRRKPQATRCLLIMAGEHYGEVISTTGILAANVMEKSACKRNKEDVIPTFVIGWFCADDTQMEDRTDPGKPVNLSSRLMMASLVCKLREQMMAEKIECDLSFINSELNWDDIGKWELGVLSEMFAKLVLQTPEGSQIICVIDEICTYEDHNFTDDADKAINALVAIANSAELLTGPRSFKLLLTFKHEASGIDKTFRSEDQVMKVPQEAEIPSPCDDYPDFSAGLEP
ncbi:hypothetical protein CTAM01_13944 [Colletotrichum tamarilloi]|uniref:Crinkler (CRN) family protein n=1 Tax=Colletotrichum tamarilloi TaxID=1209934 RepID=A0ABQ9QQM1_9PEZI|nr:uncharacterized protein CTAM01_13944 [Colletotrichum tamarilloi]KAK1481587.1 hypothetical protein CTAM01_13944 [Colletotrichum tamarilloi]